MMVDNFYASTREKKQEGLSLGKVGATEWDPISKKGKKNKIKLIKRTLQIIPMWRAEQWNPMY